MLVTIYIALYALAILASFWVANGVSRFLATHPQIASTGDLDAFKELARRNMYFALVQIVVLGSGILIGFFYIGRQGCTGLLVVLAANGALLAAGLYGRKLEKQVMSLPADDSLAAEYKRVGESWMKKALPDF